MFADQFQTVSRRIPVGATNSMIYRRFVGPRLKSRLVSHLSTFRVAQTMPMLWRVFAWLILVDGLLTENATASYRFYRDLTEGNDISDFGADNAPTGVRMNFSNRGLTSLMSGFFKSDILTELALDDNKIETLSDDAFEYLPNLSDISLANNKLKNISLRPFSELKHLRVLNLNSSIDILVFWTEPPRVFSFGFDFPKLTHLYLDHNYLGGLNFPETKWVALTHLSLSGNILSGATGNDTWRNLNKFAPVLTNLYLETIGLYSFDLSMLPNLVLIDLGNNYIGSICNKHCKGHFFFKLKGSGKLRTLILNRNYIPGIDSDAFDDAIDLTSLDLSRNQLTDIRRGTFDKLTQLRHLFLGGNQLVRLDGRISSGALKSIETSWSTDNQLSFARGAFTSLTKLKELSLYGNLLTTFPAGCLPISNSLTILDLSNNKLERIFLGQSVNLRILNIKDNPLTKVSLRRLANKSQDLDIVVGSSCSAHESWTSCV